MNKQRNEPKEYLFVDGYNIINDWESLKDIANINLEEAREELLETLAEYHYVSDIEIVVVFDAHMVKKNVGNKEQYKGIEVVYTKENETADHYIERTLDKLGRIRRIRVATSDWLEQQMVLSRGGTRVSARELEIEIMNSKKIVYKQKDEKNQQNNRELGKLDKSILDKLNNWNKSGK